MEKGNLRALAPIGVFLVLYLGLGILFEYILKIEMGFYSIPIVVIFLVALLVACFQNRKISFDDKLAIMGRGIGDKTIVTMILIFMAAGIFVGTVGRNSAESVAYLMLSFIPPEFAVAVLFVVSCFVSLAMEPRWAPLRSSRPFPLPCPPPPASIYRSAWRRSWVARCLATTCRSSRTRQSRRARVKDAP